MSKQQPAAKTKSNFLARLYRYCYANTVKTVDTLMLVTYWIKFHSLDTTLGIDLLDCDVAVDFDGQAIDITFTPDAQSVLYNFANGWYITPPMEALSKQAQAHKSVSSALRFLGTSAADVEKAIKAAKQKKAKNTLSIQADKLSMTDRRLGSTDGFCTDFTHLAKEGKLEKTYGRDKEIKKVMSVLLRRTKGNPLLIGEAGVGKTAVVEGLARVIVSDDCPEHLKGHRILSVSIGGMMSGTNLRGDFEKRFEMLIEQAKGDKMLLFIDEIHTLMSAGRNSDNSLDTANMFKPFLARGEIRVIGATTRDEYDRHICRDSAMERRFHIVDVKEPSHEATVNIVTRVGADLKKHHNIAFKDSFVTTAISLTNQLLPNRRQPDKAIDLLDSSCALARSQAEDQITEALFTESVLDMLGSSSPKLGRRYDKGHIETVSKQVAKEWKGWKAATEKFISAAHVGSRRSAWEAFKMKPFVQLITAPADAGACWFIKQMAGYLLQTEDSSIVLDWQDFTTLNKMAELSTFLLSCLDGVVIIKGLPESRHPAYNMFCEFIEEGILTLEKGRRKAGFTCNIVILAESSKSANLGFSPSNTEHSDLNGEYEALKLDKRIASIVRPDFMISLGELDHNSAEDIIRIETMALKRDFNTLVNIGHVIDRCKEMTFSEIINAVRENFEEETAMVDEIVQFLDNQPELTAESA